MYSSPHYNNGTPEGSGTGLMMLNATVITLGITLIAFLITLVAVS